MPPESDESSLELGSLESETEDPRKKLVELARCERDHSNDEDNIPTMEFTKRIRERKLRELRENKENAYASDEMLSASDVDSKATIDYDFSDSMMVEEVQKHQSECGAHKKNYQKERPRSKKDRNMKSRTLFSAIAGMI